MKIILTMLRILSLKTFLIKINIVVKQKLILYVDFGGLGDHLQFSTLPELCYKNNVDFYLNKKSKFRSDDIFDLVWKLNPFFKGLTEEEPNFGHDGFTDLKDGWDYNLSLFENWESKAMPNLIHDDRISKYPSIHYSPKKLIEYEDHTLIDLNSVSFGEYNTELIKQHIIGLKDEKLVFLLPTYSKCVIDINILNEFNITKISTEDIFHYCDLINSCKKFICLWSGSSVLSASIKNKYKKDLEIECFKNFNSHKTFGSEDKVHFWFDNIKYINC